MRKLLAAAVVVGLFALVPTPALSITHGTPDTTNRYPSVGLLAFRNADGEYEHRCSGTLIAPTIVLTAAHCTIDMARVHAYFSYQVPDDFRENPSGVPGRPHTDPGYDPNTGTNDVGVVQLSSPVSLAEYPVLPHARFLTQLKRSHRIQDDTFVNVGYGVLDGWPPPNLVLNEDRWWSTSPYRGLTHDDLVLLMTNQATGQGGTCGGDSGGPHFWKRTLIIASVTSWGDANCVSLDMTQRVDKPSVLDWIADEFGVTPPA